MPKQKTKKAVVSKFKITATGKVKHHRCGRGHLMTGMNSKRKRQLRASTSLVNTAQAKTYKNLIRGI